MAKIEYRFCGKCGSPLENGVCPKCSAAQRPQVNGNAPGTSGSAPFSAPTPAPEKPKKSKPERPKKKLNPLWWVVAVLAVILALLILHATNVINIPFLDLDTFISLDNDEIETEVTEKTRDDDTTAVTEPEDTEDTTDFEFDDDFDVREYYEKNGTVISEEKASESGNVLSEKAVAQELNKRGFKEIIYSEYDSDGEYTGLQEVSASVSTVHPTYITYYTSANGDLWTIQVVEGQIMAIPAFYLSENESEREIIVAAESYVTCYDSETDTFFKVRPNADTLLMIKVNEINAKALDELTSWEIQDHDR